MKTGIEAYLDIETTGLSPFYNEITVIGIYLCDGEKASVIQLVGEEITDVNLMESLKGVTRIYTYNGMRFDLPFINSHIGVNLAEIFDHQDLMFDCWNRNLYGGFKGVEKQLGINRELTEVNGYEAVRLWWKYVNDYDQDALDILLAYNREDVVNLKILKDILLA